MGKYIITTKGGAKMEMLDRLVAHYEEGVDLYKGGYIGCTYNDGVHVAAWFLLDMPGELQEKERGTAMYPYEISKVYGGVKFYAVRDQPTTPEFVEKAIVKLRGVANG